MDNFSTQDSLARYAIGDLNMDGSIDEQDLAILVSKRNHQAEWYQ